MREEERLPIPSHRPLPEPVKNKKSNKQLKESLKETKSSKSKTKSSKKKKEKKEKEENIDLWLEADVGNNDEDKKKANDYSSMPSDNYEDMNKKPKEKKTKSKEKKGKSRRSKDKQGGLLVKENYSEEITSPVQDTNHSNNQFNINNNNNNHNNNNNLLNGGFPMEEIVSSTPAANSSIPLAEDKILKLMYDIRILDEATNQLIASIVFTNRSFNYLVKDLNINISDSSQIELLRDAELDKFEDIKLGFQLNSQQSQEIQFVFKVSDCTAPHKLRGTLAYKYQVSIRPILKYCRIWFLKNVD